MKLMTHLNGLPSYEQSLKQRNTLINTWQKCKIGAGFEPVTSCTKSQYNNN